MFRTESLELLASRQQRPRVPRVVQPHPCSLNEQQSEKGPALPDDSPDDNPDPDDYVMQIPTALPPLSPDWSHLLGGRPHASASALDVSRALLAVGCRLSISPSTDALSEVGRCHSVGAVRSLLVRCSGERGLALAYQLAGREKPPQVGEGTNVITNGNAAPGPPDLLSPEVLRSMPKRVARFSCTSPLRHGGGPARRKASRMTEHGAGEERASSGRAAAIGLPGQPSGAGCTWSQQNG
jgi:hypothetical protein